MKKERASRRRILARCRFCGSSLEIAYEAHQESMVEVAQRIETFRSHGCPAGVVPEGMIEVERWEMYATP